MLPAARFREDHAAAGLVPEEAVGRVDDRLGRAVRGKEAERVVEVDDVAGHESLVDAPAVRPRIDRDPEPTGERLERGQRVEQVGHLGRVIESRAVRAEARAGTAPTETHPRKEMRMSAQLAADTGGERLGDLLDRAAEPGRVALVTAETGETLTYEGLTAAAASLAGRLATLGAGRGSRIALVLPDGPDFLQLLLAVTRLGATAAPLNPAYKRDEYEFYLDDLQPAAAARPRRASFPPPARPSQTTSGWWTSSREGGAIGLSAGEAAIEDERAFEPAEPDDVALLLHTSGTTSRPKQVPLRQRNLTASARTIAAFYGLGPDDVSYCAMPLFHVHGLVASTFGAARGRRLGRRAAAVRAACVLAAGSQPAASRGSRPGRRSTG